MIKNAKYILTVLSIAMICGIKCVAGENDANFAIVEANDIPGIMSMIASDIEDNFKKINTWQGRMTDVSITSIRGTQAGELLKKASKDVDSNNLPDEIQVIHNNRIDFKIDVANNHFFSFSDRTEPPAYLDPKNGKIYPLNWGPGERIFLVTSYFQTEITPLSWGTKDKVIKSRIAIKEQAGATIITDPRKAFYFGEKTLWLALRQISKNIQTPDIRHWGVVIKKKSEDNNITYRLELSSSEGKLLGIYLFSSEDGFNQPYFETYYDDGTLRSKKTIKFAQIQNVFLPRKWEVFLYFTDGGIMKQENCTIESQQINVSIPDDTFTEHKYLHNDDIFRDKIASKEYKVKDSNLVFVKDLPAPANGKQKAVPPQKPDVNEPNKP